VQQRGYEHGPDDERVQQDRAAQTDAEEFHQSVAGDEGEEDDSDDMSSDGDIDDEDEGERLDE